jgi:hypothetical protein
LLVLARHDIAERVKCHVASVRCRGRAEMYALGQRVVTGVGFVETVAMLTDLSYLSRTRRASTYSGISPHH